MHARDRVKQLAARGKTPGDLHARLCDVATAVEILAGELNDVPKGAQSFIGALDTLSTTPQPSLVERLKKAYVFAEMEAIAGGGDPVDMGVRAILASLSKTPVAMMTADHIATLCGGEDYSPTDRRYARSAVQAFQEFVAPILAAKDNRIQELESLHAESMRSLRKQFEFAPQDGDATTGKWILRADVLNAIDAQVSAANVVAGERLETIELQQKRIAEFEAQIAGLERDRRHCVDAISESNLVPPGRTLLEGIGELVRLHRHAKKRLAELETRVAVVTRQRDEEHGLSNLRSDEIDTWKKELADARARIAELEASGAATVEGLQAALNLAKRDHTAAQTALDNVKDKLQRTEQDLGAKNDRVVDLEKQLATGANDIELPTNRECLDAYEYHYKLSSASSMNRPGGESYFDLQRAGMCGVLGLVREKLGPAMAVKTLQLIETQQRVAELEKELATTRADIEAHVTQARCAAVNLGYPDKTLEDAVRAVEQQKMLDGIAAKEAEREQRACVEALSESLLVMPGRTLVEAVKDLIELHGHAKKRVNELEKEVTRQQGVIRLQNKTMEDHVSRGVHESMVADLRAKVDGLEKRIAELSTPPTVDGKTPGQVFADVSSRVPLSLPLETAREIIATKILRAFGNQGRQTPSTNAVEALDKLASYWEKGEAHEGMPEQYRRGLTDCAKELREELARLEGAKSAPTNEFPTFVASKDVIRGSYSRTAISLRPYLHVGRDIEFDDIPRLLNLGRNDVIEIRVVQRAKQ